MEKNWDGKERRSEGIRIPYPLLGIMFTLIIQTLGGVWWASAMNAKMEYLSIGQKNMETTIAASAELVSKKVAYDSWDNKSTVLYS